MLFLRHLATSVKLGELVLTHKYHGFGVFLFVFIYYVCINCAS